MRKLLIVSSLALSLASSQLALAHDDDKVDAPMQTAPGAAKAPYDVQFLDTMAAHHGDAIRMARMAVDKARSDPLRAKAQRMIDDQEAEIRVLKSMREDVAADAPAALNRKLPGMTMMDMGKLESASGEEFDRRFIDMTITHHQGAVEMSKSELKSGKNQSVKDKAREIVDKQVKEIAELKQMRSTPDREP